MNGMPLISLKNQKSSIRSLLSRRHDEEGIQRLDTNSSIDEFHVFLGTTTFQNYLLTLNVPLPNSTYIYGGADWTNTLEEGQIYLRANGKTVIGNVLIAKTPILFPHDPNIFEAVELPIFAADNILLFSTKGSVFGPSLISNSDLDRDHFYVLWDEELISNISVTKKPISFNVDRPEYNPSEYIDSLASASEVMVGMIETAITSEHYTFNHLIEVYRRYADSMDTNWIKDEENSRIICRIAKILTILFDTPKHGRWLKWESDIIEIIKNVPDFPHFDSFYSQTSQFNNFFNERTF